VSLFLVWWLRFHGPAFIVGIVFAALYKKAIMARNNNSSNTKQGQPKQLTQNEKRSGQQTLGERGQKMDRSNEERYRSREQNQKSGTRGGNR
jgi:hypothetical protein